MNEDILSIKERKNLIEQLSMEEALHDLLNTYILISQDIKNLDIKTTNIYLPVDPERDSVHNRNLESLYYESLSYLRNHQKNLKNMILRKCLVNVDFFANIEYGASPKHEKIELIFQRNILPFLDLNLKKKQF